MSDRFQFRAWDKKNKRWAVYESGEAFHLIGECTMFDCLQQYRIEEYDDLILVQCTGLRDKNGKLIFDGDILSPSQRLVVFWAEGVGPDGVGYYTLINGDIDKSHHWSFGQTQAEVSTVIGNLYEHPELLSETTTAGGEG